MRSVTSVLQTEYLQTNKLLSRENNNSHINGKQQNVHKWCWNAHMEFWGKVHKQENYKMVSSSKIKFLQYNICFCTNIDTESCIFWVLGNFLFGGRNAIALFWSSKHQRSINAFETGPLPKNTASASNVKTILKNIYANGYTERIGECAFYENL